MQYVLKICSLLSFRSSFLFFIFLSFTPFSFADEESINENVQAIRSPAIEGPATSIPTGDQAHLYQHLFGSHQPTVAPSDSENISEEIE